MGQTFLIVCFFIICTYFAFSLPTFLQQTQLVTHYIGSHLSLVLAERFKKKLQLKCAQVEFLIEQHIFIYTRTSRTNTQDLRNLFEELQILNF